MWKPGQWDVRGRGGGKDEAQREVSVVGGRSHFRSFLHSSVSQNWVSVHCYAAGAWVHSPWGTLVILHHWLEGHESPAPWTRPCSQYKLDICEAEKGEGLWEKAPHLPMNDSE